MAKSADASCQSHAARQCRGLSRAAAGVPSRRTGPRAPAVGGCVKSRPQSQHGRGSVVSPTAHLKGRLEGFREQYNGQL